MMRFNVAAGADTKSSHTVDDDGRAPTSSVALDSPVDCSPITTALLALIESRAISTACGTYTYTEIDGESV